MLELVAAAVGAAWCVWRVQSLEHHAFLSLSLQMTKQALFVGRVSGGFSKLDMRDVRPVEEIGELDEPALIRLGPIILPIPFQQIEGIQHVTHALAVQNEVAGDLVGANDNR